MTTAQWMMLALIATLGHIMAFVWYTAKKRNWRLCERTIYDIPVGDRQLRREIINSIHTPIHAVFLGACLYAGWFQNTGVAAFVASAILTTIWAEIWHYFSHRAFHLKPLHWIHAEHHHSRLNTPFTAISFSFSEKFFFDIGMLAPLALLDQFASLNFYGIAAWYVGYLVINSFSHANFEFRPPRYTKHVGRYLTTTTYHSLHHSRYTGNYGLGTRFLDRMFGTEWEDYEQLYQRITSERKPLAGLRDRVPTS